MTDDDVARLYRHRRDEAAMTGRRHALNAIQTCMARWRDDVTYSDTAALNEIERLLHRDERDRELHHFETEQENERLRAQFLSCDNLLRAVMDAMGCRMDQDPIIFARQLRAAADE